MTNAASASSVHSAARGDRGDQAQVGSGRLPWATVMRLVLSQVKHESMFYMAFWPVFIWLFTWTGDAPSVFVTFCSCIILGILPMIPGWEPQWLRALSLSSSDIRRVTLGVLFAGIAWAQILLWFGVVMFVGLDSFIGLAMILGVSALNAVEIYTHLRRTRPERSEVVDSKATGNAEPAQDPDQRVVAGAAGQQQTGAKKKWIQRLPGFGTYWSELPDGRDIEDSLIDQRMRLGARRIGSIATITVVILAFVGLARSGELQASVGILFFGAVMMLSAVAAGLGEMLKHWVIFGSSRRAWFKKVARATALRMLVIVPIYAVGLGIWFMFQRNTEVPDAVKIFGSSTTGLIATLALSGCAVAAAYWATLMILTGMGARFSGWQNFVAMMGTYTAVTGLLVLINLRAMGGLTDMIQSFENPAMGSLAHYGPLALVTVVLMLVGYEASRKLVLKYDVGNAGIYQALGM